MMPQRVMREWVSVADWVVLALDALVYVHP
jgi:hypothetical protein